MGLHIREEKKRWAVCLLLGLLLSPVNGASALSADALAARGYAPLTCTFTERCVIGAPCERAWRDWTWMLNEAEGVAYRMGSDGAARKAILLKDTRWKDYSNARAIVMPLREGIASQMTMFHDGTAVYSMQYAGGAGSGQFFRGRCEMAE